MPYKSDTISSVISRLNTQFYLPAIQREYVWTPNQIVKLFDSILRGYPISSFLFWEVKEENRSKWEVYKFLDRFRQSESRNLLAETDGVQHLTLILDGQQRLTSLLIGLKGTYTAKKKHKRKNNPDAWTEQRLYLNLFKDPSEEPEDGEIGIRYGLEFADQHPTNDSSHYWIKIGSILDYESEDRFYQFRDDLAEKFPDSTTKKQIDIAKRNLEKLFRAIWKDEVISYYVEKDQDYDRVLDIFVRANEGGTKLSKSDLLLSMVTSKWSGVNARQEIHGFVDRLNKDLVLKNDFSKDFVLKSCLTLTDLSVRYRVESFTPTNLKTIEDAWPSIKKAIEGAVVLINRLGLHAENLTSANAVIPIAYYFYKRPGITLLGSSESESKDREAVRTWITAALLNGVFGGQSDNVLTAIRQAFPESVGDFPIVSLAEKLKEQGRDLAFDDGEIEGLLALEYGEPEASLLLGLLYDTKHWSFLQPQEDHIFPQSHFTREFMTKAGIGPDTQTKYLEAEHSIANLQFLVFSENQEKLAKPFEEWIQSRSNEYCEENLIPKETELHKFENFLTFVEKRNELIKARLKSMFVSNKPATQKKA